MELMGVFYSIGGLVFGAAIVYFITSKKIFNLQSINSSLEEKNKINLEDKNSVIQQLDLSEKALETAKSEIENLKITQGELRTRIELLSEKITEQNKWYDELNIAKTTISKMDAEKARLEENISSEKQKLEEQLQSFKEQKEQLKTEFKNLANEIIKEQSKDFAIKSKKDISLLIDPMKEKIEQFKKQVSDAYNDDEKERYSLKNEIKNLLDLNKNLSKEAHNLSLALKGDNKAQGDWGEMILESILENSGLTKGREYFLQQSVTTEENKRFRPDVVVKYPGNRCVVIDSKVSLKSYEHYVNAATIEEKSIALKSHIDSVKRHIKELSAKNYQELFKDCKSPDFVMMFLPIEPAYISAVQNDPELWNNAYQNQILLISPTNLIAALRMIAELWEHDKQNKNVLKIAEESGKLVDKFVGFLEDFDKIGEHLRKSDEIFVKARNKIKGGRGNLIDKIELINKLGAKAQKSIPQSYLELED